MKISCGKLPKKLATEFSLPLMYWTFKFMEKNKTRKEFLVKKYCINEDKHQDCKCREVFEQMCRTRGQQETFEHWLNRMCKGSTTRNRFKMELIVYGDGLNFDEDEKDALNMPPKFCLLEKQG